jgi:hypothetical protein
MKNKLLVLVAILVCSCLSSAQQVDVSQVKGGIALSVSAQKGYKILSSEEKVPVLSVECIHKGKKISHVLVFSPGGEMAQPDSSFGASSNAPESVSLIIDGKTQATNWVPYGETASFAYVGKTEPERMQMIHSLLSASTVSLQFKPFLTGTTVTSTFDLTNLREELNKRPECAEQ